MLVTFPAQFDNLGNTLITLLVACTTNGWTAFMVQSMAGPSTPGGPSVLNQNWAAFFYWVAFVMSCALIVSQPLLMCPPFTLMTCLFLCS